MADNGFGQERQRTRYPAQVSKLEKVQLDPFSTPFSSPHSIYGAPIISYLRWESCLPGTNTEVNDSMTNGKAVRFLSVTIVGKCEIKALLAIGSDDNCAVGNL